MSKQNKPDPKLKRDLRLLSGIMFGKGIECIVQVTNRCNMHCGFCEFWSNPAHPLDELTLEDFERLSNSLAQESSFIISIEGGEPLIRKDIVEIVEIFAKKHHPILFTNGWYVTDELAKKLFDAGLQQAAVSIDFPNERHSEVRGVKDAFERALNAAQLLKKHAPAKGKQVNLISVIMKENLELLEELLCLSKSLGIGHMLTLLSQKGFRRGKYFLNPEESQIPSAPLSKKLLSLKQKYPHLQTFKGYLGGIDDFINQSPNLPRCLAGKRSFNIDHVGNVSVCIEKIDESIGNVRTERWSSIRNKLSGHEIGEKYKNCQDCWTLCRGLSQTLGGSTWSTLPELIQLR